MEFGEGLFTPSYGSSVFLLRRSSNVSYVLRTVSRGVEPRAEDRPGGGEGPQGRPGAAGGGSQDEGVKLIDVPTSDTGYLESHAMGLLTFGLNVTLDGCIDHTQGIVDDELHDYWTQLMDQSGAMLFGRNTYELMEGAWPAVARDEKAPRAMREWAQKLEAKAKYVVSGSRSDFPWQNTIKVEGDLREAISALKAKTERGVLVGAPKLAAALEELGLIDEYRIVVHPIISGRGPTLFHGLSSARHLELLSTQRFKSGVQALHFRRKAG